MIWVKILLTPYSSSSISLIALYRLLLCLMLVYLSRFTPSWCFHSYVPVQRSYSGYQFSKLSSRFLFFSTYLMLHPYLVESGTVPVHSVESSDWHSLKDCKIPWNSIAHNSILINNYWWNEDYKWLLKSGC